MKKWILPAVAVAVAVVGYLVLFRGSKPTTQKNSAAQVAAPAVSSTPGGASDRSEPRSGALPIMIDDDPKGDLPLEGVVFDALDKPVAGALVALSSNPPRTTLTGDDGTFAFPDLVGRGYTVTARAAAGVAGPVTARLTSKSEPLVLHLRPGGQVSVTVTGVDSKPVEGATVELRDIDVQTGKTDAAGGLMLTPVVPGGYEVVAWAPGRAKTFQFARVAVGKTEIKIMLVAGAAVSGRVLDEAGKPVAAARVRYSGASDWSLQADDRRDAVVSASDGSFRFDALPAGSFRFIGSGGDYAAGSSALIKLDGVSEKSGVEVVMPKGAVVKGRVVDQAKQPVASARVRVGVVGRNVMMAEAPRQAFTDGKGEFEIRGLPRRELAAVAIAESGASPNVALDTTAGDVKDLTLVLDIDGTIAGIVVDDKGEPLEGVQVSAGPNFRGGGNRGDMANWRLRGFPEELTDAGGRFTLTGLAPGSYLVRATRSRSGGGGNRGPGFGEGVEAETGNQNLRVVLPAEATIKGKIAFADGRVPKTFSAGVGMGGQQFGSGDGTFVLEHIAPQKYSLTIRGPEFTAKMIDVDPQAGQTLDVGAITVEAGRQVGGVVLANDKPVAGATVFAGRQIFGSGSSSNAQMGPMNRGVKQATTADDGTFELSGFGPGDVTVVAEHPTLGRSKAMVLSNNSPGQTELKVVIAPFGALAGVLRQGGKPAEGVFVTTQSTTTPGSMYSVASGPDGAYRFDKLAPDEYKVSATLGMPMMGMRFYSKVVVVASGAETTVDLTVAGGNVTLEATPVAKNGAFGAGSIWLVSGVLAATTSRELSYRLAGAGAGASQWQILTRGGSAKFVEVVAGTYTVCAAPLPVEVRGMGGMAYAEKHADTLPVFCKQTVIQASPAMQSVQLSVEIPALIGEAPGGGGSGSGSGQPAPGPPPGQTPAP
ncbi:MAG: carboxypeptidase regulatory-like domain-containing protein [Kofleriaceae bacterium]|nr:carboxypeptidase regulatory-like domain-containing protein [Kofleriaceae bacterium]